MILAMFKTQYRGRFAPSPTGALHAGSLATALGSWLHAKAHDGKWLLRIEDLDLPRCVPGADQIIMQQLSACGLQWDEDLEYQSKRTHFYADALAKLIDGKKAYGCRCTRKQIEDALLAMGQKKDRHGELIYPGTCRNRSDVIEPCAWRLRVTNPEIEATVGDFVLRRADRIFTYQLAVVVDDHLQGITHIVRGADLLDNTPRQIYLQHQLGYQTPTYVHLPLVLDSNQEKLSKQTKATAVNVSSSKDVLNALRSAALHIDLTDHRLLSKDSSESDLSVSEWLSVAVSNYQTLLNQGLIRFA
jgi:glutamyl-Q tRNA(Asp) synthetase